MEAWSKSTKRKREGESNKDNNKNNKSTRGWVSSSAGGYQLMPIRLQPLRNRGKSHDHFRYLYIRQHRAGSAVVMEEDGAHGGGEENTLFVTNVGAGEEEYLQSLFEPYGPVENVTIKSMRRVPTTRTDSNQQQQQQQRTSKRGPWLEVTQADDADARPLVFAHVSFASPDGLRAALNSHNGASSVTPEEGAPSTHLPKRGVPKWLQEYHEARPDPKTVLSEVDAFMTDFDRKQRLAEQEEEAAAGKPDADGFITVRRKGRKKVADGGVPIASTKASPALAAKAKKQESDQVLLDFYRFQRRENRRKQLADLRLRFEEDKKKIAKLRAQRKFKPF